MMDARSSLSLQLRVHPGTTHQPQAYIGVPPLPVPPRHLWYGAATHRLCCVIHLVGTLYIHPYVKHAPPNRENFRTHIYAPQTSNNRSSS